MGKGAKYWVTWARLVTSTALVVAAAGLAAAEGEPPMLPQISDDPVKLSIPAAPAVADADPLVDQMAVDVNSARYSSQDFFSTNDFDSQGADDFCIPSDVVSWTITNVDVVGAYNDPVGYAVSQVKVFFLANNGSLPGIELYQATVSGGNLVGAWAGNGSFAMTLPTPASLAGNNCYWLSVQAVQPDGFPAGEAWQWSERSLATADLSPSAYRLPNNPGSICYNWGARLATCFPPPSSNPDLTMRLSGTSRPVQDLLFLYVPIVHR